MHQFKKSLIDFIQEHNTSHIKKCDDIYNICKDLINNTGITDIKFMYSDNKFDYILINDIFELQNINGSISFIVNSQKALSNLQLLNLTDNHFIMLNSLYDWSIHNINCIYNVLKFEDHPLYTLCHYN